MKTMIPFLFAGLAVFAESPGAHAATPPPISISEDDKLTIVLENGDISQVLRMLSQAARVNIVASPEVAGLVTVNLYSVTLEQALTAILSISGFAYYRVDDVIYVTTEEKKATLPLEATDIEVRTFPINFSSSEIMLPLIQEMLSPGGKAFVAPNEMLVVRDSPSRLATVEKLLAEIDMSPRQVLITAEIISVKRNENSSIGTGFDTFPLTPNGLEAMSVGFAQSFPPVPGLTGDINQAELPTAQGLFAGTLQKNSRFFLQAVGESSDVEILASPRILCTNGMKARIQVGERLGFRITTTTQTSSLESVEFLEVGTVMEVTPKISSDGLVQMQIRPKVSTGTILAGLPTESTSEIETSMIVQDGQTIIIGGILDATKQKTRTKIPVLGDIPWLGRLFGSTKHIDNESEIVMLITPQIIGVTPTPAMKQTIDGKDQKWGNFEEKGLIHPGAPTVKRSTSKRMQDYFHRRGMIAPDTYVLKDDPGQAPTEAQPAP